MTTLADYAGDDVGDDAEESCLCERTDLGCFDHFQRNHTEGSA
ncbi:hypothetical protein [Halarchaeum sp. CBA1220]|nr:hypothetical protein [Halarchaeum sp. CBA1220]